MILRQANSGPVIVGSAPGDFLEWNGTEWVPATAGATAWATGARANKNMVASVTVADGDLACATAVTFTPALSTPNGGYIGVIVNGLAQLVGDGTKVGVDCYFSRDGGVTALALRSVQAGDLLYWNLTIAGFPLGAADRVSFAYAVSS